MLEFRDKVFITVAELLSFSKAAEALFISQPAITKHIKQMELQLNITLFDRKGSKIFLTQAGKLVYDKLKEIDGLYNELDYAVGKIKQEHTGLIRIGASSTIAQYILPSFIASFYSKYPKIDLNLFNGNSSQVEKMLQNQEIDIALVENKKQAPDLKYFTFASDRLVAITRPKSIYAKHQNVSLEALSNIPIVLREFGSGTLQILDGAFSKLGIDIKDLNTIVHLGSTEAIKRFIFSFDGIAFVSDKSIENELQLNLLSEVIVSKLSIKRELRCAIRQGVESEIVKLFIQNLMNYSF